MAKKRETCQPPIVQWLALISLAFISGNLLAANSEDFQPLFNGRDLTGWVNVNCAPETWSVQDGVIHCTGHPTGGLRTVREYENFVLELEWRHLSSGGNSGVFIWASPIAAPGVPFLRGIEVQVLDHGFNVKGKNEWYTTHGDVFPIHGATMKPFGRHNGMRSFPSEERSKGFPEWNHYRVACTNGILRLHVNGKEVSGGEDCNYRKGYIGLESEGGPVEFRNIRLQELPSSGAGADVTAPVDQGWKSLFTGLDLRGWQTNLATASGWQVQNEQIKFETVAANASSPLWTEQSFADAEFIFDCRARTALQLTDANLPAVQLRRGNTVSAEIKLGPLQPNQYRRFVLTVHGREITLSSADKLQHFTLSSDADAQGPFGLLDRGSPVEFMNLYVRELP